MTSGRPHMAALLACLAVLAALLFAAFGFFADQPPAAVGGAQRRGKPRGESGSEAKLRSSRPPAVPPPGAPPARAPGSPDEAWVTLVMQGDGFVPGALVLASSLRRVGTARALVCMVTADVTPAARAALGALFDEVAEVPYIEAPTAPLPSEKQRRLYPWIARAYTKWNCLGLTRWRRVLFADADLLMQAPADELFALPAPAGCFRSAWPLPDPYLKWWRKSHPGAAELPHGVVLPPAVLLRALRAPAFTAIAALTLLEPKAGEVDRFRAFLAARAPYGAAHRVRGNGADETSIVEYTALAGKAWAHIAPRFESIPRKPGWATGPIVGLHYHGGDKPWRVPRGTWPDLAAWWDEADRARAARPALAPWLQPPGPAPPGQRDGA